MDATFFVGKGGESSTLGMVVFCASADFSGFDESEKEGAGTSINLDSLTWFLAVILTLKSDCTGLSSTLRRASRTARLSEIKVRRD